MKKILLMSLLFSFLLVGVGCSNKKKELTIEEQIARNELAEKIMSKNRCAQIRDIVLEKCFGKDCKLQKSHFTDLSKNYDYGEFQDEGIVDGVIDGKNGTFNFTINVSVPITSPDDWELESLFVKDKDKKHYVYAIVQGKWKDPKEIERTISSISSEESDATSSSTSENNVYVSDDDLHSIENALQMEWDISNASSAVGAESSNVFKVKKESVSGNEVTVSYSLRSTYGGQKKFVDLHGVVKKNSDGSWSVVNLGY